MDMQNTKCVMILDETLPLGLLANTAAILGITLGKEIPGAVGEPVASRNGEKHLGVITCPVPILRGTPESLRILREKIASPEYRELIAADFCDVAQSCNTYPEYIGKMANTLEEDLRYFGVALCGSKKLVNKLTGNLPLLR